MKKFICKVSQPGFCVGETFVLDNNEKKFAKVESPKQELLKLQQAINKFDKELEQKISQSNSDVKTIFEITRSLLHDEGYINLAQKLINDKNLNAIEAITEASKSICKTLKSSKLEYNLQRCDDYQGITKSLTNLINNVKVVIPTKPIVLISKELTPGELSNIPSNFILGIITENGSKTSHTSILAGMLDIPYFYGIPNLLNEIHENDQIILNSEQNTVILNPTQEMIQLSLEQQQKNITEKQASNNQQINTKVKIYANIANTTEIQALINSNVDGIGLFRSEFLFLNSLNEPTEEEQFKAYKYVVESMQNKEVVIRTMDLGSDKEVSWLNLAKEKNPALGQRGLRVSLERRDLLKTQLRALMRAAVYGNLKIMLPMVIDTWEVQTVLEEINQIADDFDNQHIVYAKPDVGIMIETPAAALIANELAQYVKFFSIGTNDLTQYTLAIDRESQSLDTYNNELHDAIFKLIDLTVRAAHKHNIQVSVCGELAANSKAIPHLCEIGIDKLSVSISKLGSVKQIVNEYEQKVNNDANSKNIYELCAPTDGTLIPIDEIPNQTFVSEIKGKCIAIDSSNGKIYAPCDSTIISIAKTKHSITIRSSKGQDYLINIGIDTVKLDGHGFELFVNKSDIVKQHQLLLQFDQNYIKNKGFNPIVIITKI